MTTTADGLGVGTVTEDWTGDARFFEYSRAANPVGHQTPVVPLERFPASLYADGPTRVVPLDLSGPLAIDRGPATSPALLASFVRIVAGEHLRTGAVATSELIHVIRGSGSSVLAGATVEWSAGDFLVIPGGSQFVHHAATDAAFYWVTDEPLLRFLGVAPTEPRFAPTRFSAARCREELSKVAADPHARQRNRISVLLANADQPQTLTATHVLWAMYGLLPAGDTQRPHRHQSVALDLILDCEPGCFTLVGRSLDAAGEIADPSRVDWEPGGAFVTPPGLWHAHHNESGADAHLVPVQDAGLHTYLRSLDIRFAPPPR